MYSGSRAAACSRTAAASPPPAASPVAAAGTTYATSRLSPAASSRTITAAWATPGCAGQHRLDLAGLDPEPADLHLIIGAPGEHQLPVWGPPGQVPGPVHPLPAAPERARHEPLPGQPRPAQVPPRQPRPRDIQLPRHPRRHRAQPPVQHKHPGIGDRPARSAPAPPRSAAHCHAVESTDVSVGPYKLNSGRPNRAAHRSRQPARQRLPAADHPAPAPRTTPDQQHP